MARRRYQDVALEALQEVASDLGTSTVIRKDWANTGTLIAGTPFTQYATLDFNFQSGYTTIIFNGAGTGTAGMHFYVKLTDTEKANEMLARWREFITERMANA